jgi:excisionase family DNA binding protein
MVGTQRPYVSVAQAAEELDVSRSTIWRWIGEGRIRAYKVGPRTVRIPRDELDALIRPLGVQAAEADEAAGIWADYDPEEARAGMRAARGALEGVDTEKLKRDIRAGRGQAGRNYW